MNENEQDALDEWFFEFGLCATLPNQLITRQEAEELFALITKWAEERDFGVGGYFRPFTEEDLEPFPVDPSYDDDDDDDE